MKNSKKLKNIILILFISFTFVFSQNIAMKKSLSDDRTGQTFNNFRTDSTEAVFYKILKQDEFLYDEPKNNGEAIYTLDSESFVESVQEEDGGNFIKVRVLDKFHGIIEGWIRSTSLNNDKYYGQSFLKYKKLSKNEDINKKVNPHWIKNDIEVVYLDSTLSGAAAGTLKKGDLVFLDKIYDLKACAVNFNQNGGLVRGFLNKEALSEMAILENSSADFSKLFEKYDPVLLRNDIDRSAFISYNGVDIHNKETKEFTEDKVCKEISADTLSYRYSISSDISNIQKKLDIRKRYDKSNIAMYRFLPDENIITRLDTIKCKVLEFVSIPKSAKISMGGVEESSMTNTISKLYITHIETFNMDIVFHRETTEYEWTYTKNISTGEIVKSNTNIEKVIKRMIAFRKH